MADNWLLRELRSAATEVEEWRRQWGFQDQQAADAGRREKSSELPPSPGQASRPDPSQTRTHATKDG